MCEEVQRSCFFSALRSHLEVAVNDVTFHTFHANTKPAESDQTLPSVIAQIQKHGG